MTAPVDHGLLPAMAAALLLAGAVSVSASETRLEVASCERGTVFQHALAEGERWCMAWNHSVTGIAVRDCYVHEAQRMVLERSHQPDFAAGLGHVHGRGEQVSDGAGGYWIEGIMEPVPGDAYALRVGSASVDHRLLLESGQFGLSERFAGERVMIRLGGSQREAVTACP